MLLIGQCFVDDVGRVVLLKRIHVLSDLVFPVDALRLPEYRVVFLIQAALVRVLPIECAILPKFVVFVQYLR